MKLLPTLSNILVCSYVTILGEVWGVRSFTFRNNGRDTEKTLLFFILPLFFDSERRIKLNGGLLFIPLFRVSYTLLQIKVFRGVDEKDPRNGRRKMSLVVSLFLIVEVTTVTCQLSKKVKKIWMVVIIRVKCVLL